MVRVRGLNLYRCRVVWVMLLFYERGLRVIVGQRQAIFATAWNDTQPRRPSMFLLLPIIFLVVSLVRVVWLVIM